MTVASHPIVAQLHSIWVLTNLRVGFVVRPCILAKLINGLGLVEPVGGIWVFCLQVRVPGEEEYNLEACYGAFFSSVHVQLFRER
jgi:hypothetical protein